MKQPLLLGTAGHIDHGKTALVKALTGVDTDRLPDEKARSITIDLGFASLEASLAGGGDSGFCCRGDEPGLADCCLIPQVYNAERFGCDLSGFPVIRRITDHCRSLPAFERAAPERQPDAPGGPIGPPAGDKPG